MSERFERTGEFRIPRRGEWFEAAGPERRPTTLQVEPAISARWILRRIETPDPPPPDARKALESFKHWMEARRGHAANDNCTPCLGYADTIMQEIDRRLEQMK